MAHADYNCCAVCDSKLAYNAWDAWTKEDMCSDCAIALMKHGVEARDGASLLAWMEATDPATVFRILKAVGFTNCYYDNDVDAMFAKYAAAEPTP